MYCERGRWIRSSSDAAGHVVVVAVGDHGFVPCEKPDLVSGISETVHQPRPSSCSGVYPQATPRPSSSDRIASHYGTFEAELSWLHHHIEGGTGTLGELVCSHAPTLYVLTGAVPIVDPLVVVSTHLGLADVGGNAS